MGVVCGGTPKSYQIEPFSQRCGRHRFAVFGPQLSQTPLCIIRHSELRLVAIVKPNQKSFEIRGEVDQVQTLATFDRVRVAAGGAVLYKSVGVEKNQGLHIVPHGIDTPASAVDREFYDGAGVPAAGDNDIEMNM